MIIRSCCRISIPMSNLLKDDNVGSLGFTREQVSTIFKKFIKYDKNGNGSLDFDEAMSIPQIAENPLGMSLLKIFDQNLQGDIDFFNFVSALSQFTTNSGSLEKRAWMIFKIYDINNDGYISNGDLFQCTKSFVENSLDDVKIQQLTDRTLRYVSQTSSVDRISFEEFLNYVKVNNLLHDQIAGLEDSNKKD